MTNNTTMAVPAYTVKSKGKDEADKHVWGVFNKDSEKYVSNMEGDKWTLQAVAKLMTEGKLSEHPTLKELIQCAPYDLYADEEDDIKQGSVPDMTEWLDTVAFKYDRYYDDSTVSGELKESDPDVWKDTVKEIKAYIKLLQAVRPAMTSELYSPLSYNDATYEELLETAPFDILKRLDDAELRKMTPGEFYDYCSIYLADDAEYMQALKHFIAEGKPKKYGYMRISTMRDSQKFDRQESQLAEVGCDKIYSERVSGSVRERPELNAMLDNLKEGDVVYIVSIDRLSRSTKDLLEIVDIIKSKGASLKSLHDTWLDTTSGNPMSEFLLTVMGALGQMEREMIKSRVQEGMAVAKAKGTKLGRPKANSAKVSHALELYASGKYTTKQICDMSGISKATLFRKVKQAQEVATHE